MIYLVTNSKNLFDSDDYKIIGVEESLKLLEPLRIVGLDTETTGVDVHKDHILSLQLGCFEFQVVIDCLTVDILQYKEYIESDRLFLYWNAKFDIKQLFKFKIVPDRVYDGFLSEKLMWLGYPIVLSPEVWEDIKCDRYDYHPAEYDRKTGKLKKKPFYKIHMSLKKAGEMYLGIELDKTVRGKIIYQGLTSETIIYSATDVKYLEKIMELQLIELRKRGLLTAINYANNFVKSIAYMEFCGITINIQRWTTRLNKSKAKLEETKTILDNWLIENEPNSPYIVTDTQGDLFEGFNLKPKVTINWNSVKQVTPIFKKYGIEVQIDEETESIQEKVLAPQKDKCSLIEPYLEYKGWKKDVSTYGENFLKQINKETGRLYTNFNTIGTDTARISSGGKDKANKIDYINMLNIPADAETRACFVAEKGYSWISIDYSG